jgi:hypothetical protein
LIRSYVIGARYKVSQSRFELIDKNIEQPTVAASTIDSKPPVETKPAPATRTVNPFDHLKIEPKKPEPERTRKPAQDLLTWIQRGWAKPTISLRNICVYGPRAFRDKAIALKQIQLLAQHGWLVETKAHRYDRRLWRTPPAGATALPD